MESINKFKMEVIQNGYGESVRSRTALSDNVQGALALRVGRGQKGMRGLLRGFRLCL